MVEQKLMDRKNSKRISVPRLLTPIALAIALAACTSSTPSRVSRGSDITAEPTLSSQEYLRRADTLQGSALNQALIMALKAANEEKNSLRSAELIQRIKTQPLTQTEQAEFLLAYAEHLTAEEKPLDALNILNFSQWWQLPQQQWIDYHSLRASIYEELGDYFSASREFISLTKYIDEDQKAAIGNQIWFNLSQYSKYEIGGLYADDNEYQLAGWLQLVTIKKELAGNIKQLKSSIEDWLANNMQHPAAKNVPNDIQEILELAIIEPKNAALLLPLTGKYEKQAKLIRDGFLYAMMEDEERGEDATLTIIDTNGKDSKQLASTIANKNVDFIVGPLVKSDIEQLQAELDGSVSMLALNIPDNIDQTLATCYLTLSPEQEVEQAAKHLFSEGFKYPLILVPKGALGERVAQAFANEWKRYSQNDADISYFTTRTQLQKEINAVLGITDSQSRIVQMERLVGAQLENQPRSRRDIDAIYVVAKSSELTLIKPFIEVAINPEAKSPKLFSDSRSNSDTKRQFEDLSGIVFSDIPMLIDGNAKLDAEIDRLWPDNSNSQKRLQALGMDAYTLINELPQMKVDPSYQVKGQVGELSLDEQCVVQRELSWAEHDAL